MADDAARRREDERIQSGLVGRQIVAVRYVEIRYEGPAGDSEPGWPADGFDSVDYGVELDLSDGSTWSVIWKVSGGHQALLVYRGALVGTEVFGREDVSTWDLTARWREHAAGALARAQPVWAPSGIVESDLDLVSLVLATESGGELVLTLGEADATRRFLLGGANVAVFFSREEARAVGVLPPGTSDAV